MDDLERIYDVARQLDAASRAAYLERECGDDRELRTEVEALLSAADEAGSFLAGEARGATTASVGADLSAAQIEIGPYRLLQRIGEGGFGDVYMAEQSEPVRRRVALKVIKLGMDTREVVARFEQERQALAMMDHPNIAKVFDAGATESGRPFFVMELVSGESLIRYCDQHGLSIHERLELFTQICHAVQHAHQKGIIHRDIKPNNVLVSTRDGRPHAMVIDFGIAKATNARLTERTLFTQHRQLIGTPAYMSPEQASGSLDIDTRTDVYSLGVLLYELLTGATPFGSTELPAAAYAEIQRIICEVDPPTPSRQISQNAASLASVAAQRRTDPTKLGPLVRGELDWIVMKALEKDRGRRYPTPGGLAGDIARFLGGEAVEAAPPSTVYKARKFVARHKAAVTAAALVGCALVLGVIGTAWQAGVARDERDTARAARVAESEQRLLAEGERDRAEAIARFLSDVLSGIDPSVAQGRDTTMVKALMDDAASQITSGELSSTPDVELALRRVIGRAYIQLALSPEAAEMLEPTVALSRRIHEDEAHPDVYTALSDLAWLARRQGDAASAEDLYRRSLELRRRAEPEPGLEVARGTSNLAYVLRIRGRRDEAEELRREAATILQRVIETRRREAGGDHPKAAEMLRSAADDMRAAGDFDAAEVLYRDALETRRRLFPAGDALTVRILGNLGFLMQSREDWAGAREHYRAALELSRRLNPGDHPDVVQRVMNLAHAVGEGGDWQEASELLTEGLRMHRRLHLEDHPVAVALLGSMSVARQRLDDADGALQHAEDALDMVRRLHRGDSLRTASRMYRVADLRLAGGEVPEASESASASLAMSRRLLRERHPRLVLTLDLSARVQLELGELESALAHAREAHEIATDAIPSGDERAVTARLTLGRVLTAQERFAAAEHELLGAQNDVSAAEIPRPEQRRRCVEALIALYEAWDAAAPGAGHAETATRLREALDQD